MLPLRALKAGHNIEHVCDDVWLFSHESKSNMIEKAHLAGGRLPLLWAFL